MIEEMELVDVSCSHLCLPPHLLCTFQSSPGAVLPVTLTSTKPERVPMALVASQT